MNPPTVPEGGRAQSDSCDRDQEFTHYNVNYKPYSPIMINPVSEHATECGKNPSSAPEGGMAQSDNRDRTQEFTNIKSININPESEHIPEGGKSPPTTSECGRAQPNGCDTAQESEFVNPPPVWDCPEN